MPPIKPLVCKYANLSVPHPESLKDSNECVKVLEIIKNFNMSYGPQESLQSTYSAKDPLLTRSGKRLCLNREEYGAYRSKAPLMDKDTLSPGEDGYIEAVASLVENVFFMRKVLDECCGGQPPGLVMMEICAQCGPKLVGVKGLDSNPWSGNLTLDTRFLDEGHLGIEDFVAVKGLLLPYIGLCPEPFALKHTKKCTVCGDYYQAKGQKTVYCSETCRSRIRFKVKKQHNRPST